MRKMISLFLTVLFFGIVAAAQVGSDPAAKVILEKVSAKYKSFKAIESNFNLKVEDSKGKVQSNNNGTILIKESKPRITTSERELFCDGINVWDYVKTANQVTISNVDKTPNTIEIQNFLQISMTKTFYIN